MPRITSHANGFPPVGLLEHAWAYFIVQTGPRSTTFRLTQSGRPPHSPSLVSIVMMTAWKKKSRLWVTRKAFSLWSGLYFRKSCWALWLEIDWRPKWEAVDDKPSWLSLQSGRGEEEVYCMADIRLLQEPLSKLLPPRNKLCYMRIYGLEEAKRVTFFKLVSGWQ